MHHATNIFFLENEVDENWGASLGYEPVVTQTIWSTF